MLDLNRVKDFRVLLVGDAIVDEYRYVRPVGKAVKEAALSAMAGKTETFAGGVSAAANHVRSFCANVDVLRGPGVMWNTRMVDETYLRKLFVLHESRVQVDLGEVPKPYYNVSMCDLGSYDVVIVTDFGHGTMTKELIERVSKEARYLAVNAQTNSTNYGFNLITKYPRADFVVVDELEARLAAHDKDSPIEDVILALGFKNIIVTLGANGAIGFDGAFERQPAGTRQVVDTMGAGDAFLCVTAPFAAAGVSMKNLLRIGNAAGAIKVGIVGHRGSVDKEALRRKLNG
jgi:bifunctional ADP-heptose synthase (sugar kinase/adenylyltransferase)